MEEEDFEALNKKLDKALEKLLTLDSVTLKNKRSSHYNFGIEKPFVQDRFTIHIKLDKKLIVTCQVVFDSSHYKFPPDIIFHNLPPEEEIEDKRVLLPGEDWDLDRDDCLYTWFERVIGLIKKPEPEPELVVEELKEELKEEKKKKKRWSIFDQEDEEDDDFQEDYKPSAVKESKKAKDKIAEIFDQEEFDLMQISDDEHIETIDTTKDMEKERHATKKAEIMDSPKRDNKSMGGFKANMAEVLAKQKQKTREKPSHNKKEEMEEDQEDDIFAFPLNSPPRKQARQEWPISDYKQKEKKSQFDRKNPRLNTHDDDFDVADPHPVKVRKTAHNKEKIFDLQSPSSSRVKKTVPQQTRIFDLGTIKTADPVKEWRKKFVTGWVMKYKGHVMGYDTTDFLHCTFQFTFKLTNKNEQWAEYSRTKQVSLDEFVTKNKDSSKICKFKAQAPVIINLKLNKYSAKILNIKVISAVNMKDVESSEPDTMDLNYDLDDSRDIATLIQDIMQNIYAKIPKFHYQLEDHHPVYILD